MVWFKLEGVVKKVSPEKVIPMGEKDDFMAF